MNTGKVGGVVLQVLEIFYAVISTHIPADMMRMGDNNLGDSCCPATASDYCDFSTIKHSVYLL